MKTDLSSSLIVLALFAGARSVSSQPSLGIVPTNHQFLLHWPTNYPNFSLQGITNLASTDWVPATDAVPASYGPQAAVTVSNIGRARFFRLYSTNSATPAGMLPVPAGSFTMGNSIGDTDITDATPTNVYVSTFYMATNLVTYTQWQSVYTYATNYGYGFDNPGSGKGTNHPVQAVDWYDALKWCNARSQQEGLAPVYYTDAGLSLLYTNSQTSPFLNWAANGYRLPTEAEWEKAARGGAGGQRFPWGNTISESLANYFGNPAMYSYDSGPYGYNPAYSSGPFPYTSPVGSFSANGYGLYDMAGNVWEWCWDWYGTPYGQPSTNNPTGPATGLYRILRGGYWNGYANSARCADRNDSGPNEGNDIVGFRCVRGH